MVDQTSQPCRPLVKALEGVADPRKARGQRYSLVALLSLCVAGIMCGCKTYSAIAQWGRECDEEVARSLGFAVVTPAGVARRPGASTLFYVLRALDRVGLESHLANWTEEVLQALPPSAADEVCLGAGDAVAIDGKTLRGSAKILKRQPVDREEVGEEVPGVHLLSALSHRLGVTLAQQAVPDKGSEITSVPEMLRGLFLEGRVVTVDALLTQRAVAQAIVEKKGTM